MKNVFILIFACFISTILHAQNIVAFTQQKDNWQLWNNNDPLYIYTDSTDDWLVQKSAAFLQSDLKAVTHKNIYITHNLSSVKGNVIIIGTIKASATLHKLSAENKINLNSLQNQWEAFQIKTIQNLLPNKYHALIIAGSDKRGAAYGVFEISKQAGISPWYWWADVPIIPHQNIYVKNGTYLFPSPSVQYRGIFINDEAPAFSGWTKEKFGGVNHLVYEKVFELLLRLKANYLWPAMWGNAFNDDDTLNPILANQYGIVMGTSHHEPMLRAQQEWKRYGKGAWNYQTNQAVLDSFWKKGIENMGNHESIVTIGMRGDGDEPMTEGTATALLEKIVARQRQIIESVTHKPASATPQLWALYKEVQDYYDKGMRVPDDVTLLLCDDNWGNIRRVPKLSDTSRKGGFGMYYHFDYVGDPRNYKWINTNNIFRVWEQMHLAYDYHIRKIWIVNVGDIKPMELPISFFLDYAWNTNKWHANNLEEFHEKWAEQQFGATFKKQIAQILILYAQYNSRRKPELLSPETYSLQHYHEFETVVTEYNQLSEKAQKIYQQLKPEYKDAYYQLVLYPVMASANLNSMYLAAAKNRWFANQNNITAAKLYGDSVRYFYEQDSLMAYYYNHELANGKWNHMMDQTHIGYTYWQQPPVNKMPDIYTSPFNESQGNKLYTNNISKKINSYNKLPNKLPSFKWKYFIADSGYVSIHATNYASLQEKNGMHWQKIPFIGKTDGGITAFPVTAPEQPINNNATTLTYYFYSSDTGKIKIYTYCSPTLNIHHDDGLKYGIAVDDAPVQIISINKNDDNPQIWAKWVANNIIINPSEHYLSKPGIHKITFTLINTAIVLQKIVVDLGGLEESYLGPPESKLQ
ncbi:glycosyl hydrolase 115 family protein [Hydrotalea sandarakina]|jgi:hypothetical protein|uniref:Glycosyl hydrolase family 115 (Putative glucuronidase) n=1 Tax=Hydrotalea sandarakina TaxID=1004304 RepID=A0A2W7SG13_9BACT|nr:glycosyl hydrolase 115 family protein [Hydrotalea sandarakina]PZX61815.1 glycosyl hydrolase family 115 (putative glucuronidase) [Hydrotalea sandarakina]